MRIIVAQLVFRETGVVKDDGRKLMSFAGIVAVPPGMAVQGEHQYCIYGPSWSDLRLHPDFCVDVSQYSVGNDLGYLVTRPIWRV